MFDVSSQQEQFNRGLARLRCEQDHLFFTRYFFRARQGIRFIVNWHHQLFADLVDDVITGRKQNVIVNVPPGSSKTESFVINFIARGLSIQPRSRFLHLSGSEALAVLNSGTARELVTSDEFQSLWPMKIADDSKSKKRWNVEIDGQPAGGVYATSIAGQVTGFRAGHMAPGFQGAIIIDDPVKPEDAFSPSKLNGANRRLITTVKSRRANPETPIMLVMQRVAKNDPTDFIMNGGLGGKWHQVQIPAVIDQEYAATLEPRYRSMMPAFKEKEERSYWPYKEPLEDLLVMKRGEGKDPSGSRISKYVYNSQYDQKPTAIGGNLLKGTDFRRYRILPKIKHRKIFADTAQKTGERNDYSVFSEFGIGTDGLLYLLDLIRGRWEAPELQKRAIAFWQKCKARNIEEFGQLRKMVVEDKSSGTGLIQTIKLPPYNIPVEAKERTKDKLTRVMDAHPYIEAQQVSVPEEGPFTSDFIAECESFSPDDTHDHDDQVDTLVDAVDDMLQSGNKLRQWEALAAKESKK